MKRREQVKKQRDKTVEQKTLAAMTEQLFFDAAAAGDLASVRAALEAGVDDPAATDDSGRTALHRAAHGTHLADRFERKRILAVMDLLVKAGCPLEAKNDDGVTALYTAAELSPTVEPLRLLLDAGAQADISDDSGNHILENAHSPQVIRLLSRVIGKSAPRKAPDPRDALEAIPLTASQWRAAKKRIDAVFQALGKAGLVALQAAGDMQSDGFADCSEIYRARGGRRAGLHGFCWYTRQDRANAKRISQLPLAFWGAPKGAPSDMKRVGKLIVESFRDLGFVVLWDGTGASRPLVYLQDGN